jgi:HAD superfamily hydrolase (TIGR01549 family)
MIDENELISFDIYDTALLRNVLNPADIFDLVSLELKKRNMNITDFKKIRVWAEEKARSISQKEDIQFDDIYKIIENKVGKTRSKVIQEIELSVEEKFTIANPFIKRVFDYAKSKKKTIIFISDMYLSKEFICSLLKKNGYNGYFEVYISGDLGISKASSNMYVFLKEQLNIDRNWLHIGDNYISDYINAKKVGIASYFYRKVRDRISLEQHYSLTYSIMKAIQINYSYTSEDIKYWERFGVNVVSSLFFGFVNWLVKHLRGKDNVYFLSRDGYLPYKIYNMFKKYFNDQLPEAKYIYASRRSYQIPSIVCTDQEQGLELLTAYSNIFGQKLTLEEILYNIGLNKEAYIDLLKEYGIEDIQHEIISQKDRNRIKEFLKVIYPDIFAKCQKEIELLIKYFEQNSLYDYREINLVDVGWRCSTQQAIYRILKKKTNGYYFGTAYNVYDDIKNNVKGYAFNLGRPLRNASKIMDNVMMYEFIFCAPHGSVIGFREDGGTVVPILKEVEQNNYLYKCITFIQSGILKIIEKYLNYYDYLNDVEIQDCLRDYVKFIDEKKYEDLVEFSKLTGVVGIGDTQEVQRYVLTTSISEYLKNRRKIKEAISKNLWRDALILYGSLTELKRRKMSGLPIITWSKKAIFLIAKGLKNPRRAIQYLKRFWDRFDLLRVRK